MNYWLVKSEPFKYSWDKFVSMGKDHWDGVRNYQARNNLSAMKLNDLVLFYHSNEGMEVVGLAKVAREAYPDPTIDDPRWVVVDLEPVEKLPKPVTLKTIKEDPMLQDMALIKQSRLSVMPVKAIEFDRILVLSNEN
jgi:predicted RNA-binding protein with PUA-like domain